MSITTMAQGIEKDAVLIVTTIKNDAEKVFAWAGLNEQTAIGLLKPVLLDIATIAQQIEPQIELILPDIGKAFVSGGYAAALAQTVLSLGPILKAAGIELEQDIELVLQAALVARAKALIASVTTTTAPVITPIPSAPIDASITEGN